MQRNSVISLRPLGVFEVRDMTGVDPEATYGCVDWYLYHDAALADDAAGAVCSTRGKPLAAIERAAGAAAAAETHASTTG